LSSHAVSNNIDDNMSIHNVGCFISFSLGALCYCFDIEWDLIICAAIVALRNL
jgi:hypothetical protein